VAWVECGPELVAINSAQPLGGSAKSNLVVLNCPQELSHSASEQSIAKSWLEITFKEEQET
jgi:hypothetical protein